MISEPTRIVVGITGATGAVYAVRLLERLRESGADIHLVVTPAGLLNVHHELGLDRKALESLADVAYSPGDVGAAIASGSFSARAMVVAPCSMKSLAAIAHGLSDNLLTRAADVTLKERRRLVLERQAEEAAERAETTGRPVALDAMSAIERKVVHEHLKERGGVETFSEGQEPDRHLVVAPLSDS